MRQVFSLLLLAVLATSSTAAQPRVYFNTLLWQEKMFNIWIESATVSTLSDDDATWVIEHCSSMFRDLNSHGVFLYTDERAVGYFYQDSSCLRQNGESSVECQARLVVYRLKLEPNTSSYVLTPFPLLADEDVITIYTNNTIDALDLSAAHRLFPLAQLWAKPDTVVQKRNHLN